MKAKKCLAVIMSIAMLVAIFPAQSLGAAETESIVLESETDVQAEMGEEEPDESTETPGESEEVPAVTETDSSDSGYVAEEVADGTNSDIIYAAQIGEMKYETLVAAIEAANAMENPEVTVLTDCGQQHNTAEEGIRYIIKAPMTIRGAEGMLPRIYGSLRIDLADGVTAPVTVEGLEIVHSGILSSDINADEKCGVHVKNGSIIFTGNTIRLSSPMSGDLLASPSAMQISKSATNEALLSYVINGNTIGTYSGYSTINNSFCAGIFGVADDKTRYGKLDETDWDAVYENNTFEEGTDLPVSLFDYRAYVYTFAVATSEAGLEEANSALAPGFAMVNIREGLWKSLSPAPELTQDEVLESANADVTVDAENNVITATLSKKNVTAMNVKFALDEGEILEASGTNTSIGGSNKDYLVIKSPVAGEEYTLTISGNGQSRVYKVEVINPFAPPADIEAPVITQDKIMSSDKCAVEVDEETKHIKVRLTQMTVSAMNFKLQLGETERLSVTGESSFINGSYVVLKPPVAGSAYSLTITNNFGSTEYSMEVIDLASTMTPPEITVEDILESANCTVTVDNSGKNIELMLTKKDVASLNFRVRLDEYETISVTGTGASVGGSKKDYFSLKEIDLKEDYLLSITNPVETVVYTIRVTDPYFSLPDITEAKILSSVNGTVRVDETEKVITVKLAGRNISVINYQIALDKGETISVTGERALVGGTNGDYMVINTPEAETLYGITIKNKYGETAYTVVVESPDLPQDEKLPEITSEKILAAGNGIVTEVDSIYHTIKFRLTAAKAQTANISFNLTPTEELSVADERITQIKGVKNNYISMSDLGNGTVHGFTIANTLGSADYTIEVENPFEAALTQPPVISILDIWYPSNCQPRVDGGNKIITLQLTKPAPGSLCFAVSLIGGAALATEGGTNARISGSVNNYFAVTNPEPGQEFVLVISNGHGSNEYKVVIEAMPADYSKVEAVIEKAEALDANLYTQKSYENLMTVIAAVEYGLPKTEQSTVDFMAKAIEEAISHLIPANTVPDILESDILSSDNCTVYMNQEEKVITIMPVRKGVSALNFKVKLAPYESLATTETDSSIAKVKNNYFILYNPTAGYTSSLTISDTEGNSTEYTAVAAAAKPEILQSEIVLTSNCSVKVENNTDTIYVTPASTSVLALNFAVKRAIGETMEFESEGGSGRVNNNYYVIYNPNPDCVYYLILRDGDGDVTRYNVVVQS